MLWKCQMELIIGLSRIAAIQKSAGSKRWLLSLCMDEINIVRKQQEQEWVWILKRSRKKRTQLSSACSIYTEHPKLHILDRYAVFESMGSYPMSCLTEGQRLSAWNVHSQNVGRSSWEVHVCDKCLVELRLILYHLFPRLCSCRTAPKYFPFQVAVFGLFLLCLSQAKAP